MNREETKKLCKRLLASKHWRWMAGMRALDSSGESWRGAFGEALGAEVAELSGCDGASGEDGSAAFELLPDLNDPATLGCLLALVRAALPYEHVWLARDCVVDPLDDDEYIVGKRGGWTVWGASHDEFVKTCGSGSTEAEALVAALEAAE